MMSCVPGHPMSDPSLHEIGFGWIPNINGKVTCSTHIKKCIVKDSKINPYGIEFGEPIGNKITLLVPITTVNENKTRYLYVQLDDDSGKCTLFLDEEFYSLLYKDGKVDPIIEKILHLTWKDLRCTIDSSSKPMDRTERSIYKNLHNNISKHIKKKITNRKIACSCSAMDRFVITLNKTNPSYYDEILNLFESVNEDMSDGLRALPSNRFVDDRATLEYNQLYTESFINLYKTTNIVTKQENILEFRHRKAEIISKHIESKHSWWDTKIFIISLVVASAALAISCWNLFH